MQQAAILEVFSDLSDQRQASGKRHPLSLCLALFTMAVVAGNHGFLAIGDWLESYREQLLEIFQPEKGRLPSYSTIRRVLLTIDNGEYAKRLAQFFVVTPQVGETIAVDGKVLRGSYQVASDASTLEPHPAIMLVNAYIVERGLILDQYEVDRKTNEIKALPEFIKLLALKGVVFAFDAISTQKKLAS